MGETTNSVRRRRTLLPWVGGKSKLAAQIIAHLPNHRTYVEPFCGGCAVFFQKERSAAEVLNDADNRLVTLLRVFRFHPDELLRELTYLTHSRREFADALAQPGITDIQRAARFLFVIQACFGAKVLSPTFGYGKTAKANFHRDAVESVINAARERLDGVTIENLDFADVLGRYDSPQTLFYCDPPYIDTGGYACKFTMDDHRRLRARLETVAGKAVVSLNDCAKVRDLYAGWRFVELSTTYTISGSGNLASKAQRGEVLIFKP